MTDSGAKSDKMIKDGDKLTGLQKLLQQFKEQKYPPVHLWEPDYCGEIDIRIASDGTWYYMGTPIGRQRLVNLFSSVIRLDEQGDDKNFPPDGDYFLVTPVEKMKITVDVAPLYVVRMKVEEKDGNQAIFFETRTSDMVLLSAENPLWVETKGEDEEPQPFVMVRSNLKALISRSVFYELVSLADEIQKDGKTIFEITSMDARFQLGEVPYDG